MMCGGGGCVMCGWVCDVWRGGCDVWRGGCVMVDGYVMCGGEGVSVEGGCVMCGGEGVMCGGGASDVWRGV